MSNKKGRLSMRVWTAIILFMFISAIAGGVEYKNNKRRRTLQNYGQKLGS